MGSVAWTRSGVGKADPLAPPFLLLLQLVINGIALGAAYALVALGFVLILNATSAVNFAQGDMVTAGGYAAAVLASLMPGPVPAILLLPLVAALMALFGLLFSLVAYFPLMNRPPVERKAAVGWGSYEEVVAALKSALARGPYLLGERFSAADVYVGSEIRFAMMFGAPGLKGEKVFDDYVARLAARPAARRTAGG